MSLRHAVLGLLAAQPATGYELTQKFDTSLGNAWHASHSQIYPELGKLEGEGMIEVVATGARNSRTFAITDAGHQELRRWLVEVPPSRVQRSESAIRTFLTPRLLAPADARFALERDLAYIVESRATMDQIQRDIGDAGGTSPFAPALDLGLRVNSVIQQWLHDQLAALPETED
jgi:PadR family transcriptional regulator AphA